MAASISGQVKRCLEINKHLAESLNKPQIDLPDGVALSLGDQKSRFAVWSGNIGAHRTGTSSLEHRLRDASHIKENVVDLLEELENLMNDARGIMDGEVIPWDQLPDDEGGYDARPDMEEDEDSDMPDTEIQQLAMDIKEVVDNLLRLSMTIKNPAPHDRFFASGATDTSHFESFDIQHVQSKYGSAVEPWLAERLGKAISRRRQYFRYRQEHHEKLAHGMDDDDQGVAPSTLASSIPERFKKGQAVVADDDDDSDAGRMSQTSFATSAAGPAEKLHVPPMPAEAADGPFECPFCYMIISISDRRAWKKHVFGDLRPYVCLEHNCVNPDQEFGRRHEWLDHMKQNHWTKYTCPLECGSRKFQSAGECKAHLDSHHPGQVQPHQVDALIKLHAEDAADSMRFSCSFCPETFWSMKSFQKHVGRHQEQLCLFALPALDNDEGEDNEEREEEEEEHSSTQGTDREDDGNVEVAQSGVVEATSIDVDFGSSFSSTSSLSSDSLSMWPPQEGEAPTQASSYWSVAEANDFPRLLKAFGSDWVGIAAHMGSKTPVMVKNYYVRQKDQGKPEWEAFVNEADMKRALGESAQEAGVSVRADNDATPQDALDSETLLQTGRFAKSRAKAADEQAIGQGDPVIGRDSLDLSSNQIRQHEPTESLSYGENIQAAGAEYDGMDYITSEDLESFKLSPRVHAEVYLTNFLAQGQAQQAQPQGQSLTQGGAERTDGPTKDDLRDDGDPASLYRSGREFLCPYEGCVNGQPGNGLPQPFMIVDHLKRVHNPEDPTAVLTLLRETRDLRQQRIEQEESAGKYP